MNISDLLWPDGPVDLPPESGDINAVRFEPNNSWLSAAPADLQKAAVWRWFATHYEDPRQAVPHHETQSDFLWGDGEPVHADHALHDRFDPVVPHDVINTVLNALRAEVGNEWALKRLDKVGA